MKELDLGRLLNTARRGGEISYDRLSKACGGTPTGKRLHQLENGPLKNFPDPETIKSLSMGTGFSVTEILFACARSLKLPVQADDPDSIRIHGLSTAPARFTELFRELGREIVSLVDKEVVGNADHPAPIVAHPGYQDEHDLAADSERNRGKEINQRYESLGEESQDHGGHE